MATTLGITPLIQNQLQFNLDVPPCAAAFATQQRRPGPIVVEKLATGQPSVNLTSASPLRLSTVSEQDMEIAVRLAKRDIRKKKMAIEMEEYTQKLAEKANALKTVDKKEEERRKARERLGLTNKRPVKQVKGIQTKPKIISTKTRSLPPRSYSPPTRDTDMYPTKDKDLTPDERTALEIRRLRKDLKTYVDEINRIDDAIIAQPARSMKTDVALHDDLTDEEIQLKKMARLHGRATRSSRMVYDLKQQVRSIYDEIKCTRPETLEPRKKSEVIKRLASAHRGTVRALQDLTQQLPDADYGGEVGRISRELSGLIEQLTDCCAQLEIAGDQSTPDNVAKLVQKNPAVATVWKEVVPQQKAVKPSKKSVKPAPDRNEALKAHLAALIKARDESPEKPEPVEEPSVKIQLEHQNKKRTAKSGVLINRPKKKPSDQKPEKSVTIMDKPHYTEATISHKHKVREPVRTRSRSRSPTPRSPRHITHHNQLETLNLGMPNEWAEEAESAIKRRLQPLITKAEGMSLSDTPGSRRHMLSERARKRIEGHTGHLVDLILEDVLKDNPPHKHQDAEFDEMIASEAAAMLHGPSLSAMMCKLDIIDREQREIRDRWTSVTYHDKLPGSHRAECLSDRPQTPGATVLDTVMEPYGTTRPKLDSHPKVEKSPIVFTNQSTAARLRAEKLEALRQAQTPSSPVQEFPYDEIPRERPNFTRSAFRELPKKTEKSDDVDDEDSVKDVPILSHLKNGPTWHLVEKLSNEIMEEMVMQELALGQSIPFSTDENFTENAVTESERYHVNFNDDSCMDLHDMIHDENERSHVTETEIGYHGDSEDISYQDDRRQGDEERLDLDKFDIGHLDENLSAEPEKLPSYHDDRRQGDPVPKPRSSLHLSIDTDIATSIDTDRVDHHGNSGRYGDKEWEEDEETEEDGEDEEDAEEGGEDVEYSSEFVTTTGTGTADDSAPNTAR